MQEEYLQSDGLYGDSRDVQGYTQSLELLNNEFAGLIGQKGMAMGIVSFQDGSQYLTQNEIGLHADEVKQLNADAAVLNNASSGAQVNALGHSLMDDRGEDLVKQYAESKRSDMRSRVTLMSVNKIMVGGKDSGEREVTQYNPDGSEVHVIYDLNGPVDGEGKMDYTSMSFRSAEYVQQYNSNLAGTSFNSNSYVTNLNGGGFTPQEFKQYTQPAVLNINANTDPNQVVATFIAAVQYEATNGNGPTRANIFNYFNNMGGQWTYNFGSVNFISQGINITANSITFDYTGTAPGASGAILVVNPSQLQVNRLINNALRDRDNAFGNWRGMGFSLPQFNGIGFGVRLPEW